MENVVRTFLASASLIQSSDSYMTIKMAMLSCPSANLNGVRCTMSFIDEIVQNQEKYLSLPLVADVKNLEAKNFDRLGHLYDPNTDTYGTQQIGSFYKFDKEERDGETYLIGYARVSKRDKKVCSAITELFASGGLKFSFEITCGAYKKLSDGTIEISADNSNTLTAQCIVSNPACQEAVAYQLVAESEGKEAEPMDEKVAEVTAEAVETEEVKEAEVQVEAQTEEVEVKAEEEKAETEEVEVKTEEAETKAEEAEVKVEETEAKAEETAEVCVTEVSREERTVSAFDTETGEESTTTVCVDQVTRNYQAEGEETPAQGGDTPAADPEIETAVTDSLDSNATKREMAEIRELIKNLAEENEALKQELAEIKDSMTAKLTAEKAKFEINPFMDEIKFGDGYSLLKEESPSRTTEYTLL